MIVPLFTQATRESGTDRLRNYLQVGYLLHGMAILNAAACIYTVQFAMAQISPDHLLALIFILWLCSFFFMNVVFAQLDAYSRYQNFKQVRDQLYANGYQERIVKPLAKSSCQRVAARFASKQVKLDKQVKAQYYEMGYRWYHILPDFVWQNPLFFFHPLFWKSTFLVKRYRSVYF